MLPAGNLRRRFDGAKTRLQPCRLHALLATLADNRRDRLG